MSGKVIEMPKSNQQQWDDLFNGFQNQIDRLQAKREAEMVNLDDLGITLGEYETDYRDEEPYWSDALTEIERQNSIKGR